MLSSIPMLLLTLLLMVGPMAPGAAASVVIPSAMATEVAASGHLAGDADEVPADEDQGTPHHHGVDHDHDIGGIIIAFPLAALPLAPGTMSYWGAPTLSSSAPKSDLRPPIA